jgi:hypothetical protein
MISSNVSNNNNNNNNNSIQLFITYVPSHQLQGQLQTQHSVDTIIIIESNSVLTIMIITIIIIGQNDLLI